MTKGQASRLCSEDFIVTLKSSSFMTSAPVFFCSEPPVQWHLLTNTGFAAISGQVVKL
jgi:hypothetical protein